MITPEEQACLDIYKDCDDDEIKSFSPSIIKAWKIGEQIASREYE